MPKSDTLYDDIHDEMEDYVDMISWFNNHRMATDLAENDLVDDEEQQLSGLYCLFGIELHLTAAGVPSTSKKCPIREHFLPYNAFRFNPELLEPFRTRIKQIAELRIAAGFPEKEINAAANAMIARVEKAVIVSAHLPDLPIGPPPPPLKQTSSMLGFGHRNPVDLLYQEVPPWWHELLLRCRDVCEECVDVAKLRSKLQGRVSASRLARADYSDYMGSIRYYPLIEPSMVDWLEKETEQADPRFPSLLYCVIESSIFNAQPLPERRLQRTTSDHFFYLAWRVMLEAAARKSPAGVRKYLPSKSKSGIGVFRAPLNGSHHTIIDQKNRDLLLMGWSGIYTKHSFNDTWNISAHSAELWNEICDLSLLDNIYFKIPYPNEEGELLHVIHAWCAWCAGAWNEDTIRSLFPDQMIKWYSRNLLKPSDYDYRDERFTAFCGDLNNVVADAINDYAENNDMKSLRTVFHSHKGAVRMETLLCIAENIKPKESLKDYRSFLNVTILPEATALKSCIKRIKSLPQETIRRFAICSGLAYPFFLDAIDDAEFRRLLKLLLDTFSESLVVDPDNWPLPTLKPTPDYPGRTPSGVTNLNPLYEAISSSSPELWNSVIQEADRSDMIPEIGKRFLQSMVKISRTTDPDISSFLEFPAITRLTHRAPVSADDCMKDRQSRLDGLAELLDDKDSYWPNTVVETGIKNVRVASRLYAESRGIESWQEAALEMADSLFLLDPVACGTYTIHQSVTNLRGAIVYKGKAKEPLKSISPALQKEEKSKLILNRCRLFQLLYRALVRDFVEAWVETGERPKKECTDAFERIFQMTVLPMLEPLPDQMLSAGEIELLRHKIVREFDRTLDYDRNPYKQQIVIDRIQHFDWTFDFSLKSGTHKLQRNFAKQNPSFCFMPVTEDDKEPKIDKKKPLEMELKFIEIESESCLCTEDPRIDRIVQCLAYEIGMAREPVKK